jgi:hypothetical protein
MTDLLSFGPSLLWHPFFVRHKTLALMSAFHLPMMHVVPVTLDPDPYGLNDYVLVTFQYLGLECLDYARSTFHTGNPLLSGYQQFRFANAGEYLRASKTVIVQPEYVVLASHVDQGLDLLALGGCGLYVSDHLKQALEQAHTTGINTSATMLPAIN